MRISRRLVLAVFLLMSQIGEAQDQPNIVLIFLDNFGWGEPGFTAGASSEAPPLRGWTRLPPKGCV